MGNPLFGVGLIAAGPAAQAIHLPTLERFADRFAVVHVADVNEDVAREVAGRVGARYSTDAAALLADPRVDVVVVGSPDRFHAAQVIAACEAGKAAVLCEKPLAVTVAEAEAIAAASISTGVPVVVGTMHAFDTAWVSAVREWEHRRVTPHTVRVSAVLPPNPWAEDFATEIAGRPVGQASDRDDLDARVATLRGGVLGLATHDLPLARRLLPPGPVSVIAATDLAPWGAEIIATVGDSVLELHGAVGVTWEPEWTVEATAKDVSLQVAFPLSYVHAGSSTAVIADGEQSTVFGPYPDDGYLNEWEHVYDVLTGELPAPSPQSLVADLKFAMDIASQAEKVFREAIWA